MQVFERKKLPVCELYPLAQTEQTVLSPVQHGNFHALKTRAEIMKLRLLPNLGVLIFCIYLPKFPKCLSV